MEPEENALTKAGQNSFKNHLKEQVAHLISSAPTLKYQTFSLYCMPIQNIEPPVFSHQYPSTRSATIFSKVRYYGIHFRCKSAINTKEILQMMPKPRKHHPYIDGNYYPIIENTKTAMSPVWS
ncbi:MAG: hypothetical protein H6572_09020 [Lewinellaceae bacterium]|nr:hypothetical protein [Lewinellaceae bacterium]